MDGNSDVGEVRGTEGGRSTIFGGKIFKLGNLRTPSISSLLDE